MSQGFYSLIKPYYTGQKETYHYARTPNTDLGGGALDLFVPFPNEATLNKSSFSAFSLLNTKEKENINTT